MYSSMGRPTANIFSERGSKSFLRQQDSTSMVTDYTTPEIPEIQYASVGDEHDLLKQMHIFQLISILSTMSLKFLPFSTSLHYNIARMSADSMVSSLRS